VLNRQSDGWVYVSVTKNGVQRYGYFRGEYLSSTPVSIVTPGASIDTATVNTWLNGGNGRTLNLREEPSTSASVLTRIPNGSKLSVYQKGYIWWQVSYNGLVGYVDSGFLATGGSGGYNPDPSYSVNAYIRTDNGGKLNLREQANTTARVLGQYENGVGVNVIQRGSTWCYVQVGSQYGYMMTRYLTVSGGSTTKVVVNNNGGTYVNLRTSPDKNSYNVNLQVPVGATVTVLSWGQEWSQVNYAGYTGYMMSWFLK
ncbi:MAG: SH3 domain-containing protein, partial [Clostridia bacterium]|nr:SH3 domain-containing protein [Clostridia bacterium]